MPCARRSALGSSTHCTPTSFPTPAAPCLAHPSACASATPHADISAGIAALAHRTLSRIAPATELFPDGRPIRRAGAAPHRCGRHVSLSTDCNPGTSYDRVDAMVMQLATLADEDNTVEESLTAATLTAPVSLRIANETGSIEPGKRPIWFCSRLPN